MSFPSAGRVHRALRRTGGHRGLWDRIAPTAPSPEPRWRPSWCGPLTWPKPDQPVSVTPRATSTPPTSTGWPPPVSPQGLLNRAAAVLPRRSRKDGHLPRPRPRHHPNTGTPCASRHLQGRQYRILADTNRRHHRCWGLRPGRLTRQKAYKAIAAGGDHSCAIRTDDTITCWGYNDFGQADAPEGTYKAISAGGVRTCAIRTDGTLACWGYLFSGQADPPSGTYKSLSTSGDHTCAIRADDAIVCWGDNDYLQADEPGIYARYNWRSTG